jgi:outer membrane biogenesis lipoprotein LolB
MNLRPKIAAALIGIIQSAMKYTITLLAFSFLLAGCNKLPSDPQVRQKASGTWEMPTEHAVITFDADGSCVSKVPGVDLVMQGTWQVDRGFFTLTITNAVGSVPHAPLGEVQRYKIVSMNDHDLVLQMEGETNLLRAHKQ